jgi:ketosteroid isomerase-like protein
VDAEAAARAWIDGWSAGWRALDPDPIAERYAEDAVFHSLVFRAPHRGREAVRDYAAENFSLEEDVEFWFGEPVADGDRAAVEWWASMREAGHVVTLAGVALLRFREDGLVAEHRDVWAAMDGRRAPFEGWGG